MRMERIAQVSIFIALGVGLGYAFAPVPNVELVIPTIFLSGVLLGKREGGITGFLTFLIFGFFNPYGPSPPPLLFAQVLGGMMVGVCGGFIPPGRLSFFLSGFLLTLLYDILTNLSGYILFPGGKTFLAYMVAGLSFSLIHIVSNTLIFGVVVYPLYSKLKHGR